MEIKTSLDFNDVEYEILRTLVKIRNPSNLMEAAKLLKNIREMNTKLSQLEVEDRRLHGRNRHNVAEQVLLINNELENLHIL